MENIQSVFSGLKQAHLAESLVSLNIKLASDFTHTIDLPIFPSLTQLHLGLDDFKSSSYPVFTHCKHANSNGDTTFIVRAPKLQTLSMYPSDTTTIRVKDPEQLKNLTINFLSVGCLRGCWMDGSPRSTKWCLQGALLCPKSLFDDFDNVAEGLTHLDLSIKISWLGNVDRLHFANVTTLTLRITAPYNIPQPSTVIRLDAPKLERGTLFICDTRIIDFAGSSFTANVKQLTVCTPCYKMKTMTVDSRRWTRNNFIVKFPLLEQVTRMHGIHNATMPPDNIQWSKVKRLALAMDIGIADLVAHISMPELEKIMLVCPEWRMKETSWGDSKDERTATSDEESEQSTGMSWAMAPGMNFITREMIIGHYKLERRKLSAYFPHIQITNCHTFDRPDRDYFDVLKRVHIHR